MTVSRIFTSFFSVAVIGFVCLGANISPVFAQGGAPQSLTKAPTQLDNDNVSSKGSDKKADEFLEYDEAGEAKQGVDNQAFFDAENLVPQGQMTRQGPNPVDPVMQPASKLVIVKKAYDPDAKESQLVSAERAMGLGRYDSALELFDILYEKNKKDARVLMGRAVALQKIGRFDEAMGMYEELSGVAPDNVDVKVNMLGLLSTRYPSVALRRLLDLREGNKSNAGLMAQIAICYASLGDMNEALRYLGAAASIEPNNAGHLYNMAIISDKTGDEKHAVSYYEKALEVDSVYGSGRSIPRDAVYERLAQIR